MNNSWTTPEHSPKLIQPSVGPGTSGFNDNEDIFRSESNATIAEPTMQSPDLSTRSGALAGFLGTARALQAIGEAVPLTTLNGTASFLENIANLAKTSAEGASQLSKHTEDVKQRLADDFGRNPSIDSVIERQFRGFESALNVTLGGLKQFQESFILVKNHQDECGQTSDLTTTNESTQRSDSVTPVAPAKEVVTELAGIGELTKTTTEGAICSGKHANDVIHHLSTTPEHGLVELGPYINLYSQHFPGQFSHPDGMLPIPTRDDESASRSDVQSSDDPNEVRGLLYALTTDTSKKDKKVALINGWLDELSQAYPNHTMETPRCKPFYDALRGYISSKLQKRGKTSQWRQDPVKWSKVQKEYQGLLHNTAQATSTKVLTMVGHIANAIELIGEAVPGASPLKSVGSAMERVTDLAKTAQGNKDEAIRLSKHADDLRLWLRAGATDTNERLKCILNEVLKSLQQCQKSRRIERFKGFIFAEDRKDKLRELQRELDAAVQIFMVSIYFFIRAETSNLTMSASADYEYE
ncbi:hypothetical protein VNI00_003624 [Paramarasmius palmivorus]|uniref:Uncharacterized protein n=1 Tax=Paramarasmius palmivorus TaxID=297713 RepID=A0AAW0DU18_9AGAR